MTWANSGGFTTSWENLVVWYEPVDEAELNYLKASNVTPPVFSTLLKLDLETGTADVLVGGDYRWCCGSREDSVEFKKEDTFCPRCRRRAPVIRAVEFDETAKPGTWRFITG